MSQSTYLIQHVQPWSYACNMSAMLASLLYISAHITTTSTAPAFQLMSSLAAAWHINSNTSSSSISTTVPTAARRVQRI